MPVLVPRRDQPKIVPKDLMMAENNIRAILEKADRNKDGCFTREELKEAVKELGSYVPGWRAIRCLMKADADNDGLICGDEIDAVVDYLITRGFGKKT